MTRPRRPFASRDTRRQSAHHTRPQRRDAPTLAVKGEPGDSGMRTEIEYKPAYTMLTLELGSAAKR